MTDRSRLDVLLTKRGLVESREKAQGLIMAGEVLVDGQVEHKAHRMCDERTVLEIKAGPRFVSRGGDKLEAAVVHFKLDVRGRVAIDVGSSTGGFTDCLLQHGVEKVFCVDVGHGQLHWKLRKDPRVVVMEGVNGRSIEPGLFPADQLPDLAVADVSFISLTKVLGAVISVLKRPAQMVTLIKPQFEAGRSQVGHGGVVRDESVREAVVSGIRRFGENDLGLTWCGVIPSPLLGPAGNVEFLAYWKIGATK
jgi:23S rRNA (cytidine1920-2'-O)/16S rRNA (cytidine1409-2'-O)-methyltransferase